MASVFGPALGAMTGALLAAASMVLVGCVQDEPAGGDAGPPTDAQIVAYLQDKARSHQPHVQVLLTDFTFSPDKRYVCGMLRIPGRTPEVFASIDLEPATVDRSFGLPYLAGRSTPEPVRQARSRVLNEDICVKHGLMPNSMR